MTSCPRGRLGYSPGMRRYPWRPDTRPPAVGVAVACSSAAADHTGAACVRLPSSRLELLTVLSRL